MCITLFSILSSICYFGAYSLKNTNINIAVNNLADDIRYVQSISMAESKKYVIMVKDSETYQIGYETEKDKYHITETKTLPENIAFYINTRVYFTKRGTVTSAATFTLMEKNSGKIAYEMTVNVGAGRVLIKNAG